jgi:hypothetical protein
MLSERTSKALDGIRKENKMESRVHRKDVSTGSEGGVRTYPLGTTAPTLPP